MSVLTSNPLLRLESRALRAVTLQPGQFSGWPALLREFYEKFDCAEGFLGQSYIAIYPERDFHLLNNLSEFDSRWSGIQFFATDGGGETFGFLPMGKSHVFVSAPAIGSFEDTINLGDEAEFVDRLMTNSVFDAPKLQLKND